MENQNIVGIKTLQIIWGFLFIWTGALIFLANNVSGTPMQSDYSQIKMIFSVLALGEFGLAMFLPKLVNAERLKTLTAQSSLSKKVEATFVGWIIQFALFESICLLGFVLAFAMTKQFSDMLPFVGLSYLGFILRFPTEEKVEKMCAVS